MNLHHLETHSAPFGPAHAERCQYCAGPVVPVTSRKHRRARCAGCAADVRPRRCSTVSGSPRALATTTDPRWRAAQAGRTRFGPRSPAAVVPIRLAPTLPLEEFSASGARSFGHSLPQDLRKIRVVVDL